MKIKNKITAALTALTLSLSMASAVPASMGATAADDCNDDWLHAVGSRLYDAQGNEVWLTGANWFGYNCSENIAHGLYARDVDDFLASVSEKGINIIRIPISSELLLSWMNGTPNDVSSVTAGYDPPEDAVGEDGTVTPAGTYVNVNRDFVGSDGKTLKSSLEIFDIIMGKMKKYGLKVLVDVHSPAAHNSGHNYNLWYYNEAAEDCGGMAKTADGKEVTFQDWVDSITWLAERYANDDTILAYDLKNEPHGKRGYSGSTCPDGIARWDDTELENNWAYAATVCGKSILSVNPNALILIEGVEQYPKTDKGYTYDTPDIWDAPPEKSPWYGAWWGGNLRGVKDYPIDFGSDKLNAQIVYSPHDYGPSVYAQTWFAKEFTTQTLLDDYWYDTWAYINDQDIAPLLIGEWGGHMDKGDNQKWMELLRDYMIEHHINHTFWCLNPNSGDTGGLLDTQFKNWDADKYGLFEPSLWQTASSGKYIGLDHATPLGGAGSTTGISVSDYYAKYAASEGSNLDAGGSTSPVDPTPIETKPAETQPTETKPAETADPGVSTRCGDVNLDGEVDILDVVALNKNLMIGTKLEPQGKLNAVTDGTKRDPDATDSLNILKWVIGIVPKLPV